MAQTTILSSISNTDGIVTSNITASNNCGTLSLILTQIWTKQMLFELPNLNFTILYNGTVYTDFNVNMETINIRTNKDTDSDLNVEPYSIAIYNIPSSFELVVTPMFDRNAVNAHNELIDNGIEDGALWTHSDTFPIKILFDDDNVSSGGTSGGEGGGASITIDTQVNPDSDNPVKNKAIYRFVTDAISNNTANFIGTFNSVQELNNYSGVVNNNDYAFVVGTDAHGNTEYSRYKFTNSSNSWKFEYVLNNSGFTANQWDSVNSGMTQDDKTKLDSLENTKSISNSQIAQILATI